MQQFSILLSWHLFTAQRVSGVFPPIIKSSMTAVAAFGFTFVSWWQSCCVRGRAGRPDHELVEEGAGSIMSMKNSNDTPPSSAKIKINGVIHSLPPYASMAYTATALRLTDFKASDYNPLLLAATCITSCEFDVRKGPVCEWVRQTGYAGGGGGVL
jgi:hypothetical protein